MSVAIIAKAKNDLEVSGQTFTTDCDAYKITNLAAQRTPGWKVVEKTGGVNCQNRKVDGILADGQLYDVLIGGGPPSNQNTPAWQLIGPQGDLVAKDPYDWPDPVDGNTDPPLVPPTNGDMDLTILRALEDITLTQATHTELLEQIRNQVAADTARIIENDNQNTEKIQQQLAKIVEDAEKTLKEVLAAYVIMNRPEQTAKIRTEKK